MPDEELQQIPTILWLLKSGGIAPLALGLLLAAIGIVFLIRPNRMASTILAFASLLPALVGLIVVYSAAADCAEMAVSPTAPKPAEFAAIIGRAMSNSFCALLGTLLPVFFAVLAMLRAFSSPRALDVATRSRQRKRKTTTG